MFSSLSIISQHVRGRCVQCRVQGRPASAACSDGASGGKAGAPEAGRAAGERIQFGGGYRRVCLGAGVQEEVWVYTPTMHRWVQTRRAAVIARLALRGYGVTDAATTVCAGAAETIEPQQTAVTRVIGRGWVSAAQAGRLGPCGSQGKGRRGIGNSVRVLAAAVAPSLRGQPCACGRWAGSRPRAAPPCALN